MRRIIAAVTASESIASQVWSTQLVDLIITPIVHYLPCSMAADWTVPDSQTGFPAPSGSFLHERQPAKPEELLQSLIW